MGPMFPKPRIFASSCLGFSKCRYDGSMMPSAIVSEMRKFVDFVTVCPEMEMGLGAPRDPIKILSLKGERILMQPATGLDFSGKMNRFAEDYLSGLGEADGFILKAKSPSCGLFDVKEFTGENGEVSKGRKFSGFFGKKVMEKYPDVPWEDEMRLLNGEIRGCFLKRVFTLARFREVKKAGRMKGLVDFHERHKLLLMAFSQEGMRSLGGVVANPDGKDFHEAAGRYEAGLRKLLRHGMCSKSASISLMHAFGYFKEGLNPEEKRFFLEVMGGYRAGKVMLSAPRGILWSWVLRFGEEHLRSQFFFEPYPKELIMAENQVYAGV